MPISEMAYQLEPPITSGLPTIRPEPRPALPRIPFSRRRISSAAALCRGQDAIVFFFAVELVDVVVLEVDGDGVDRRSALGS
jgi:hypothetical protein